MTTIFDINELTDTLISFAYPELGKKEVVVSWGRTSVFGQVSWGHDSHKISVRINKKLENWHHAGITGLISHELSHPAQSGSGLKEIKTDQDVISRGLGTYLAVERLLAGKYNDHIVVGGKDRYLGYRSIRAQLTTLELQDLDSLMSKMKLRPTSIPRQTWQSHDSAIFEGKESAIISIDGNQFEIPYRSQSPDIKTVNREGIVLVYVDEVLVGKYQDDSFF